MLVDILAASSISVINFVTVIYIVLLAYFLRIDYFTVLCISTAQCVLTCAMDTSLVEVRVLAFHSQPRDNPRFYIALASQARVNPPLE